MSGAGKKSSQEKPKKGSPRVTWAQATRDILIAAMNRGQLPLFAVAAIFFAMMWRMPADDIGDLANRIVDAFVAFTLVGWALSALLMTGWFYHARYMRQQYSAEYGRIGSEKAELQAQAAGSSFPGSQPKRRK